MVPCGKHSAGDALSWERFAPVRSLRRRSTPRRSQLLKSANRVGGLEFLNARRQDGVDRRTGSTVGAGVAVLGAITGGEALGSLDASAEVDGVAVGSVAAEGWPHA